VIGGGVSESLESDFSDGSVATTIDFLRGYSRYAFRNALSAVRDSGISALIVDSMAPSGGVIAEYLGLPFVTLSFSPPIYLEDGVPPPICTWQMGSSLSAIRRANSLLTHQFQPLLDELNLQRRGLGLAQISQFNDTFSKLAIITQMPRAFDFERDTRPTQLFYAGHFRAAGMHNRCKFPWDALDGRLLIYATLGTVRNIGPSIFRCIAEGCSRSDAQVVVSLGGGKVFPCHVSPTPGNAIVVHYAPQLDLIARSDLVICHAGMNTTLEALREGKPLVAIPICDDQPGVAARIQQSGAGTILSRRRLSPASLAEAVEQVLFEPRFKAAAGRMRAALTEEAGAPRAADIIERLLNLNLGGRMEPRIEGAVSYDRQD
jgi:MGT family glycosyltransferase